MRLKMIFLDQNETKFGYETKYNYETKNDFFGSKWDYCIEGPKSIKNLFS